MKTKKRYIVSALLALIMIFSAFNLSGCYVINSGKMSKIEGTYELTGYTTDKNEMEERGIVLYVVIKSDGTGYYAYSDNDTELYYSSIRCKFTKDEENDDKYDYVEMDFEKNGAYKKFGVNAQFMSKTTLSSSVPQWGGNLLEGTLAIDYYISVTFTRVDKATDLSYVKSVLGDAPMK